MIDSQRDSHAGCLRLGRRAVEVFIIKVGEDMTAVDVQIGREPLMREIRQVRSFREAIAIIERRLPQASPTIEFPDRFGARRFIADSPHISEERKRQLLDKLESLGEFDRIIFDALPYPVPNKDGNIQGGQVSDVPPPLRPLTIVFVDP